MSKKNEFASMDLLSAFKEPKKSDTSIPLSDIIPNPDQPRIIGKDTIDDLVDSISKLGLIEPIVIRPHHGKYMIIAGERRFRAVKKIGWKEIPVKILDVDSDLSYEIALAENEKRKSLNPWEVGRAIVYLRKDKKKTASEVSEILGYSERYVKQLSSIARLDQKSVEAFLANGKEPSVKNLERLLKEKESGVRGEMISPPREKVSINIGALSQRKKDAFLKDLILLKRKYGLE